MNVKYATLCGALVFGAACGGNTAQSTAGAAASPASASPAAASPAAARGSANVIIEAELAAAGVSDAFQAVKLLRPSMLRARNGSMNDQSGGIDIVVYLDGVKSGGPSALELIPALTVREIRFLSASDATTRFGTGHPMGAIVVSTKR